MTGRVVLLLMGLILLFACENQKPIMDIATVVNKTPQQVESILGTPDTAYTQTIVTKHIFTQIYNKDVFNIEIMYPDGLSTDVVVLNGAPKLPFDASAIKQFGLNEIPPSHFQEKAFIKWKNYPGYKTINIFVTDLDSVGNVEQFRLFFKSDGKEKN